MFRLQVTAETEWLILNLCMLTFRPTVCEHALCSSLYCFIQNYYIFMCACFGYIKYFQIILNNNQYLNKFSYSNHICMLHLTGPSQENFLYQMSKVQLPQKIVHEELALQWVVSSGSAKELAMSNSWFVNCFQNNIVHYDLVLLLKFLLV